jgi:hypothetical protein
MELAKALRIQLERQVSHWDSASLALTRPEDFASQAAWQALERYLDVAIRSSLDKSTKRLRSEVGGLRVQLNNSHSVAELRTVQRRLEHVRQLYQKVETVVGFFSEAVNTRTSSRLATLLSATDFIAVQSMRTVLQPLGVTVPPVLTYVDKGLGASILRAGVRLWDGEISPAASIKVTRHNILRPTSVTHETGHQVAHLLGWNAEIVPLILSALRSEPGLGELWASWASESTADAFAFACCGYAAVAALHDVVANDTHSVLRILPGDPHPVAYLRVLLGTEMCKRFGSGPWDDLAAAWTVVYSTRDLPAATREVMERSRQYLPQLVGILLDRPLQCFGGRPLTRLVDPGRVTPAALEAMARDAGPSLFTSAHWASREALRIVALTGLRIATDPSQTTKHSDDYVRFTQTIRSLAPAQTAA